MANHSFVTTRKWLKADRVEEDLKEILLKRFGNKMSYTREGDYFVVGFDWPYEVPFWVENVHKLEFRNQMPNWCWWVQNILHNEFALLYNGWVSDEAVLPERWRGTPNKYPTFYSYLKARSKGHPWGLKLVGHLLKMMDNAPKQVKETYGGLGR